jgi:isopenicillin N synthase-like dioxygenase
VGRRDDAVSVAPVVDLRRPIAEVAEAIDGACREVGFWQVIGHGLDADLEDEAWVAARRFFDLDHDAKLRSIIPPGGAYGFTPLAGERLAASLGADTPPDLKETFSSGPSSIPDEIAADPAAAFVYSPTPWPDVLPQMRDTWVPYYDALAGLAARIMSAMAVALGLPDDHFDSSIDRHTSALRALHYPDLGGTPPEPGQLRAGAHTDYGTLTLLRQDDAPGGLEVLGVDGTWHAVPPVEGAYVVNVADALARWTNDRWRSTLHRVVTPPVDAGRDCTRRSMAFFHNANWDAVIECLPTCRSPGQRPRYAAIGAGRHLMEKFRSTQE